MAAKKKSTGRRTGGSTVRGRMMEEGMEPKRGSLRSGAGAKKTTGRSSSKGRSTGSSGRVGGSTKKRTSRRKKTSRRRRP